MLSREVSTLECVQHPYILRLFEGNFKFIKIGILILNKNKFIFVKNAAVHNLLSI